MAVSGKTAAPHEIPYFLDTDKPPNMATVTKAIADQTAARLDAIAPKQIVGATKKQLLIANASGVVTAVTASGDVTNDEAGVFSIGANKVATAMIQDDAVTAAKIAADAVGASEIAAGAVAESEVADGAVTSRKFKPTVLFAEGSGLAMTFSYQAIPSLSVKVTPSVNSYLLLDYSIPYQANTERGVAVQKILVNGSSQDLRNFFISVGWAAPICGKVRLSLSASVEYTITIEVKKGELSGGLDVGLGPYIHGLLVAR